jgi:geranylgeranyl diphosphate synthase, type II
MTEVLPASQSVRSAAARIEHLRQRVDSALAELPLPDEPQELYAPVRYVLDGGGKRLRPVLLLLAAEACGCPADDAMPAALAAEVFHNFTLVHDDIMDHAAERRGRPAVHVVWNESTAILTGDLMMGLAYNLLAQTPRTDLAPLFDTFHRMVAAVCEGQALDEAFERRPDVTVEDYLDMISRKTGALLVCVLELGARIAGASGETLARLADAGRHLGRAFQIQDDLLDLTADDADWGKTIGGDLVEGKKTFLLLRAVERASGADREWFEQIAARPGLPPEHVPEARRRMAVLGVLDEAVAEVRRHSEAGIAALESLPETDAREALVWLAQRLALRVR